MKKFILTICALSSLAGCQTTPSEREVAIINGTQELSYDSAAEVIDSLPSPTLKGPEFTQTKREARNAIIASQLDHFYYLGNRPVMFKMPVKLTKEMYNPRAEGFDVPLSTMALARAGAIETDYDVSVLSTNNLAALEGSGVNRLLNWRILNLQVLNNLAVAQATTEEDKELLIDLKLGERLFTDDQELNVRLVTDSFYGKHSYQRYYSKRASYDEDGYLMQSPRYAYMFLGASPDIAESYLGRELDLVFMPNMMFKIPQTGQIIIIAESKFNGAIYDRGADPLTTKALKGSVYRNAWAMSNDYNLKPATDYLVNEMIENKKLVPFIIEPNQYLDKY